MEKRRTLETAHGCWREILLHFGLPATVLNGKHHPCPSCGGKDRFRFHDRDNDGDYYCSQCGAGKGISLVAKINDWDYAEAAKRVDEYLGERPTSAPVQEQKKAADPTIALRDLSKRSKKIEEGDPAWLYLYHRGLKVSSKALRFVPGMYHAADKHEHPGMIATVCDAEGKNATLHRTYLTSDGGKANVEPFRMLMPGVFPKGGAIRLSPAAERMGVAEGIETALSASAITGMPVWSTVSEALLQAWQPPAEAKEVIIFGDNDENFVGQSAAYALAKRLTLEHDLNIKVMIPDRVGTDWNDVWLREVSHDRAA